MIDGDLLTPDEQLQHIPRWHETKNLRTAIIDIFVANGVFPTEVFYEQESLIRSVDELELLIMALVNKGTNSGVARKDGPV